jgi:TRAP-type C4-dicarboxylate transport system permease small subunit
VVCPRFLDRVEAAIRSFSRALAWIAGGIFLASALLVTLDVVTRAITRRVVFESFELSCYGFAIAIALGFAHTVGERTNVRVDFLHPFLPRRVRTALDVLAILALAAFAIVFAYQVVNVALTSIGMGARSNSSLAMPLKYPQGAWALGMAWFAIVATFFALRSLAYALGRRWDKVDAIAGVRLTQSADANRESL